MDRRINERREWCSDEHMQCALRIYYYYYRLLSYLYLGLR